MNCECNNKSNRVKPGIKHVYGNVLRMAIPLTLRTLVKDGDEMVVTDTDFIPSSDHPVRVVFSKGKTNYPIIATMDGNVAIVEDKGKIPVGTYDISVECYDDLGNPYRFKQNAVLYVTDTTAEAGIDEEIEYEAQTWYLNAAVFLATTEIGEIGDAIDAKLDDVFGNVAYDANAKEIRFYNKDNSRVLATIDSRPFIVDGTVADVYIDVSRQVLVVVLNDDAGGTRFSVPLYLVFNSYYKKDEVDSLVSRTEKGLRFDFSQELPLVVHVTKNGSSYSSPVDFGAIQNAIREDGRLVVACVNNDIFYQLLVADRAEIAFSRVVALDGYQELLIVDPHNVWSMEDVDLGTGGGGGGYEPPAGGIPKTDLASGVQASLNKADTALQQSDLDGYATTDDVDDAIAALVSSAPQTLDTLKELADALGDDPNFATTMATQLGNKVDKETGKSLMTDAERTKLQGIAAGAEVNVQADWNQTTTTADDYIKNKPSIPTKTSDLTNDSGFIDKAMYYGESTTAAATMPKVCTVETFPTYTNNGVTHAKEGTIIAVKFTNSDTNTTAAPELNVNGIGAKAIMYNNAIVTSTAKNTTVAGTAKMLAYYRYDPELDEGNGAWEFLAKSVDSNSTYSNASLGQGYGTQTNSSAATAITSSISSYALSAGGIVTIKFTYDVPANATLNINGKGAKAIYNKDDAITSGVIKAGDTATFIYNTYYHLIAVDSWQDKQDAISDLATIRSGAAAGATALQSYTETDPTVPAWAKASTKPSYTASEISGLATVATSGSYNDLSNKPTIPAAQVNSDWDAPSGVAQILNKPTFKTINGQSLVGSGNITVVGEKGDKGDTGNVTVTDGVAQITIVNDLTTGGTGDALSAEMGKYLGQTALVGMGTFAQAYVKSQSNHDLWCWMLNDMVDGEVIRKPIWHVGSGTFVDAVGSVVSIAIAPPAEPVFSLDDSEDVLSGSTLNVTFFGTLHYIIDGGTEQTTSTSPLALTLNADTDIEAWVEDSIGLLSQHVTKSYSIAIDHKLQFKIALTGDNSTEYVPITNANGPKYNMTVDWGDGTTTDYSNNGADKTGIKKGCGHSYIGNAGDEFIITIRGTSCDTLVWKDDTCCNPAALVAILDNTLECATAHGSATSVGFGANLESISANALSNNTYGHISFTGTKLTSLPDGLLSHLTKIGYNLTDCSNMFQNLSISITASQMNELKGAIGNVTNFGSMFYGFKGTVQIPDDFFDLVAGSSVTKCNYMTHISGAGLTGDAGALYNVLSTKVTTSANVSGCFNGQGLTNKTGVPSPWIN